MLDFCLKVPSSTKYNLIQIQNIFIYQVLTLAQQLIVSHKLQATFNKVSSNEYYNS